MIRARRKLAKCRIAYICLIALALVSTSTVAQAAATLTLSADHTSAVIPVGGYISVALSVQTDAVGPASTITLSGLSSSPNVSFSFDDSVVKSSGTAHLTINASPSSGSISATVTITATNGPLTRTVTVPVTVVPVSRFSLNVTPPVQSVGQARTVAYKTAFITPANFGETIIFTVTGLPPGVTASIDQEGQSKNPQAVITLSASKSAALSTSTFAVVVGSAGVTWTTKAQLIVRSPDFRLESSVSSRATKSGSSVVHTVTVTPLNGFQDVVNFSVSGLPAGAVATFNPARLKGAGTTTLTVNNPKNAAAGSSNLTISASNGSITHTAFLAMTLNNPDFQLSVTPAAQSAELTASAVYTVAVAPLNGFNGNVGLSINGLAPGVTAVFGTSTVNTPGSTTLTITSATNTAPATYVFTLTASGSSVTHTAPVTLVIPFDPDFNLTVSPSSLQSVAPGSSVGYGFNITAVNGFADTINLSTDGLDSCMAVSLSPSTINGAGSGTFTIAAPTSCAPGQYAFSIIAASGDLVHVFPVTINVDSPVPSPWADHDIGAVGLTGNSGYDIPSGTFIALGSGIDLNNPNNHNPDSFNYLYQPLNGNGSIVARLAGYQGGEAGLMIRESLDPQSANYFVQINNGALAVSYRSASGAQSVYQNSGPIVLPYWFKLVRSGNTFSAYSSPDGVTWTLVVNSASLTMGASAYVGFAVEALNNTLHSASFDNVTINGGQDFILAATAPTSLTTFPGSLTATYNLSATNLNGFSAPIALSVTGLPSQASAVFSPGQVNGSGNAQLLVTTTAGTPTGSYTLTVTGTSGALSHSAPITLVVSSSAPGNILPDRWGDMDIGASMTGTGASFANGIFSVTGTGCCLWNGVDKFNFAYQSLTGDGTIVARLISRQNIVSSAKAGVMIRETLAAGARNVLMDLENGYGLNFQDRPQANMGYSQWTGPGVVEPYWFKLVRAGVNFSGFSSPDGVTWTQQGPTVAIAMASTVYIGLAVSPEADGTTMTANFDNVYVSGSPDFYLTTMQPGSRTTYPGGLTASYTFSVAALNGFASPVSFSTSGLPSGSSASFSLPSIVGSDTTTMMLTTTAGTPTGTYTVTVTAAGGGATRTAQVTLVVAASAPPNALPDPWLDLDIGASMTGTGASYSGSVFTVAGTGCCIYNNSDKLNFAYVPLRGDGTIVARLVNRQNVVSSAKAGVMIRESLAADSKDVMMDLENSYGLNFQYRSTIEGGYGQYLGPNNIGTPYWFKLVRSGNSFSGYRSPDGVNWYQQGSTVGISMAANVFVGLAVSPEANGTVMTATFDNVTVTPGPDFSVSIGQPGTVAGATTSYPVNVTGLYGFSGNVTLGASGAPSGATASVTPASITGSGNGTLAVNSGTAAPGSYTVSVTGTAGAISHIAAIPALIGSLPPSPWLDTDIGQVGQQGSVLWNSGMFLVRGSGQDLDNPTYGSPDSFHYVYQPISGDVTIVAQLNSTAGNQFGLMVRETFDPGSKNAMVEINSQTQAYFTSRAVTGSPSSWTSGPAISAPYWLKLVRQGNSFTAFVSPNGSTWSQIGSSVTVNMAANAYVGVFAFALNQSTTAAGLFSNVSVTSTPDFSLSAYPPSQNVLPGASTNYSVGISPLGGFAGGVALSVAGLPLGVSAAFNPTAVVAGSNGLLMVATSTSTPPGNYTITITGTNGAQTHSVNVGISVGSADFSVLTTPTAQTIAIGGTSAVTVLVNPSGGFTGPVTLTVGNLPPGVGATLTPTTITTSGRGTLNLVAAGNAPLGSSTITITASSGSISHTATLNLTVSNTPDFSLTSAAGTGTIAPGATIIYPLSIGSLNGFNGIVSFAANGLPAGSSAVFTPSTIANSGPVTVTISTSPTTPIGSFLPVITGTSAGLSHAISLTLNADATSDYSVSANPTTTVTTPGANPAFSISTGSTNGFNAAVSFSATPLPGGAAPLFVPSTANVGSGPATLTIPIPAALTPGIYSVTVTATSGILQRTALITLDVRTYNLTLTPSVGGPNATGGTQLMTATLLNGLGAPVQGSTIQFAITGANSRTGSAVTNASGVATYTYTGTASGPDTVTTSTTVSGTNVQSNAATINWITPVQTISTTTVTGKFFAGNGTVGAFIATPSQTPLFTQSFPNINFNPPANTVPGSGSSGVTINSSPMVNVTTDINGNYTGKITVQGNGYQAGAGTLTNFNVVFTGTFIVASAGNIQFNFYSDDGFIFGVAGGATLVSNTNANINLPASGLTPFQSYPVMGGVNQANSASARSITVNFPGPGRYDYEIDYTECCTPPLVLTLAVPIASNPVGIPPTSVLKLTPNSVSSQSSTQPQTFTVQLTDASGAVIPSTQVTLVISGLNTQQLTATTDATGTATFTYSDTHGAGSDLVQAQAIITGTVAYSNAVTVPWTTGGNQPPVVSAGSNQTITLPSGATLSGTATDDGLPAGSTLTVTWSQLSGPGTTTFANAHAAATTATFNSAGVYVLQLSATDTLLTTNSQVTVTVLPQTAGLSFPSTAFGPYITGTQQSFTTTLTSAGGSPLPGVAVQFTVTGANSATGSVTTNSNGQATFLYTGSLKGTDSLTATANNGGGNVSGGPIPVYWITPAQPVSTTGITGQFFTSNDSGSFNAVPAQQPLFTQTFQSILFDPPAGTVPGNTSVDVNTRPFTQISVDASGNFIGTVPAIGNGYQSSIGPLFSINVVFNGKLVIAAAGTYTFNFTSDDGFILGISGATRVSGVNINPPASGQTVFFGYPVMGADNTNHFPTNDSITVQFPAPGIYPFEIDYFDCCRPTPGPLSLTMGFTNGSANQYVSQLTNLILTANAGNSQTTGQQQAFTVLATDASNQPVPSLPISLLIGGGNPQSLSATTDATGHAAFSYTGANAGTADQLQAQAGINGVTTYSNVVTFNWNTGVNLPPVVNAGQAETITFPAVAPLSGTISDDGLPLHSTLTINWSLVNGPTGGVVLFDDPHSPIAAASFNIPGTYVLQLSASDSAYTTTSNVTITVNPGASVQGGWIGSPAYGATLTGPTPITVAAGTTLTSGTLTLYPTNNINAVTTLNANTTGSGTLATFDPTTLPTGSYWVQLVATNSTPSTQNSLVLVTVAGDYKPGRVTATVTDLVVPAAGLPITISRTYDSLNRGTSGDFGYGWTLNTNMQFQVGPTYDVTFTLNGQARTFYFTPQPNALFQFFYTPQYTAEPGMFGTLAIKSDNCAGVMIKSGNIYRCGIDQTAVYQPLVFTYTDPYGRVYTIGSTGALQSLKDLNNNTLTITPNGITSSAGNLNVPFVRDAQGRITQITDPLGKIYTYTYDTTGNLHSTTFPTTPAPVTTYTYDTSHLLTGGLDARNNPLPATVYYPDGRVHTITDALGNTTSYAYNTATNTTTITYPPDSAGHVGTATLTYDGYGKLLTSTDPLNHTTTNVYNPDHTLQSVTDPLNHTTSYTYDGNGNQTSVTYPHTATSVSTTSSTTYNQYSEQLTKTDEIGNIQTFTYDANHNPSKISDTLDGAASTRATIIVNANGTVQSMAVGYDLATSPNKAVRYTYDQYGNKTSETDQLGRQTTYTYDTMGRLLTTTPPLPTPSTSPASVTTTNHYDALGNLTSVTAPLASATSYQYDSNRNKISETDPNGRVTQYQYDAQNRLITVTYPTSPVTTATYTYDFRGNIIQTTNQAGHITHNEYDLAGRLTAATTAYGTTDASRTTYTYDNAGRRTAVTDANNHTTTSNYDEASRLTSVVDPRTDTTSYTYDDAGNRTSVTDANSHTTQFQYDSRHRLRKTIFHDTTFKLQNYDGAGNLISVTDQAGNVVQYTYDDANQLKSVIQTNHPDPVHNTTSYAYDNEGNLTAATDLNIHTTQSGFDLLNRLTAMTFPSGAPSETRTYDPVGNLLTLVDHNGKTTTYGYDALNRLLTKTPDPTLGETGVIFTYTATGKRATMVDPSGSTTYTYDNMDRLKTKATPQGTLTYAYDAASNVSSITSSNANGISVNYTYDELNRLTTVVDNRLSAGQNTTTYAYDAASNLVTVSYPNGLQSTLNYDTLNRLKSLPITKGSMIANYTYQLDPNGNRQSVAESSGRAIAWTYDGIYRLTNETISGDPHSKNGSAAYGLDPVGNRLSVTSTLAAILSGTFAYNPNDGLSTETYDNNGNVLTSGGKIFKYDFENRLKDGNNGQILMAYDGDGNRVTKTIGGTTTRYLVDDLNPTGYSQVVEELAGGSVQRTYTYGSSRISENQLVSSVWQSSFYGYDGSGSVRMLTDSTGTVTDTYDYDAFGNIANSTGSTSNNYLYRGEQFDLDLGFYYLRARYFNPATGRFLTRDPAAGQMLDPITLHKYLYANGDPVNRSDPSGRAAPERAPGGGTTAEYATLVQNIALNLFFLYEIGVIPAIVDEIHCIWSNAADTLSVAACTGSDCEDTQYAGPHPLEGCGGTCRYKCTVHPIGDFGHGNTNENIISIVNRRRCEESCAIAQRQVESVIRLRYPLGVHNQHCFETCHD